MILAGSYGTVRKVTARLSAPVAVPIGTPTARIKAPAPVLVTEVLEPKESVDIEFSDLTADLARQSYIGYYPRPKGSRIRPSMDLYGHVYAAFVYPVAGNVLIWIDSPGADGKVEHAEMEVTVGTPGPVPPPDPPEPPTPPEPVVQKVQIVVIEESEDSTAAFARVRNSKAIRDWADAGGHAVFFIDIDAAKAAGGSWGTWAAKAAGKALPYAFIAPVEGGDVITEQSAPNAVDAFLALAKRYGGEGTAGCPGVCPTTRKAVAQ